MKAGQEKIVRLAFGPKATLTQERPERLSGESATGVVVAFSEIARMKEPAEPARDLAAFYKQPPRFTPHEIEELTKAYETGRNAGVLGHFDTYQNLAFERFRMFRQEDLLALIFVSREKRGKLSHYRCWTHHNATEDWYEGPNFGTCLSSVRGAIRDMIDFCNKPGDPEP